MASYPKRRSCWAHRLVRLMTKSAAAQSIGHAAWVLVATIAHQEDSKRYRGPVTFFTQQLMQILGIAKWETLDRARKTAIEFGWLHYESKGRRKAGIYWTLIPADLLDLDDKPVDETTSYHANGDDLQTENRTLYPANGDNEGDNEGDDMGDDMGDPSTLYPSPPPPPPPPGAAPQDSWEEVEGVLRGVGMGDYKRTVDDAKAKCLNPDEVLSIVREFRSRGDEFRTPGAISWRIKTGEWPVAKQPGARKRQPTRSEALNRFVQSRERDLLAGGVRSPDERSRMIRAELLRDGASEGECETAGYPEPSRIVTGGELVAADDEGLNDERQHP